jgi:hypothetical protein
LARGQLLLLRHRRKPRDAALLVQIRVVQFFLFQDVTVMNVPFFFEIQQLLHLSLLHKLKKIFSELDLSAGLDLDQ